MSTKRYDFSYRDTEQNFELLYVSHSLYGDDWHSKPHTHYCTELFCVVNGKGFIQVDSQQFPVRKGELFIINPHTLHTELSFAEDCLEYIVMGINGIQFCTKESNDIHLTDTTINTEHGDYCFYFNNILHEMEEKQEGYQEICAKLAYVFLVQLQRRISQQTVPLNRTKTNSECARIRQYLDDHFTEHITLDLLADMVHINKHHLVHLFSKEIGCSPINYLLAKRILESKRLLKGCNYSVSEISHCLGFSSPNYFSQRFKKAVGLTPLEYRRAARSQESTIPALAPHLT